METTDNSTSTGFVKFYNAKAKFGFIICSVTKKEYYVRSSGLIDQVKDGDSVSFQIEPHPKGPKAVQVQVIRE